MSNMNLRIEQLTLQDADIVFDWVLRLLRELGEEGEELGELEREKVLEKWMEREQQYLVLAAKNEAGTMLGILTLSIAFAIYANGEYGVIDEMYVDPQYRSAKIGAALVEAATKIGRTKGWMRIDVTAPESERWARTQKFYENLGFQFTGPKLKLLL
jgi:GNAT superfamily N-acetyltransferase